MVLVAWAIVLVWHVLEAFTKLKAIGLYVMPVVLVLLTVALVEYNPPVGLAPALRSDIVIVHVSVMLVAIGALYVGGGPPSSTSSRRRCCGAARPAASSDACRPWRRSIGSSTTPRCWACPSSRWAWLPA